MQEIISKVVTLCQVIYICIRHRGMSIFSNLVVPTFDTLSSDVGWMGHQHAGVSHRRQKFETSVRLVLMLIFLTLITFIDVRTNKIHFYRKRNPARRCLQCINSKTNLIFQYLVSLSLPKLWAGFRVYINCEHMLIMLIEM